MRKAGRVVIFEFGRSDWMVVRSAIAVCRLFSVIKGAPNRVVLGQATNIMMTAIGRRYLYFGQDSML